MRKGIGLLFVCGALLLCGCNDSEVPSEEEEIARSADVADTQLDSSSDVEGDIPQEFVESVAESNMHDLMRVYMLRMYRNPGISCEETDTHAFWEMMFAAFGECGYLAVENGCAEAAEDGRIIAESAVVREYAKALFGVEMELPDIPEEMTGVTYQAENDSYAFAYEDYLAAQSGDNYLETRMESFNTNGDGTYTVAVQIVKQQSAGYGTEPETETEPLETTDTGADADEVDQVVLRTFRFQVAPAIYTDGSSMPVFQYYIIDAQELEI